MMQQKVKKFVAGVRRRTALRRAAAGAALILTAFLLSSTLLDIFFAAFPLVFFPLLLNITFVLAVLCTAAWILDCFIFHFPDLYTTAVSLERGSGQPHSLLSISLELDKNGHPGQLAGQVHKIAAEQLPLFKEKKDNALKRNMLLFSGSLLIYVAMLAAIEPNVSAYWRMPLSFLNKADAGISPGSVKIKMNASVEMALTPIKTHFPSCRILVSDADGGISKSRFLRPDSSGNFVFKIDSVKESFTYRFLYGGKTFGPESVSVIAPPVLYSLQVMLSPPAYTGLKQTTLPEGQGDFSAYAGTKVKIALEAEGLADAWVVLDSDSLRMRVKENRAESEFTVWKQSEYTIALRDTYGQFSDSLPSFGIGVIPDEPPVVHFLKPGFNKNLSPAMVETLWVEGVDDLGIRSTEIMYCKGGECQDTVLRWDISSPVKERIVRKQVVWNLNRLSLYPGDTLFYWARVRDSKPFAPLQVAFSDTFWFRVPGFEEIHRKIVEQEKSAEKAIGEVREKQDKLEDMLDNLVKSATGSEELTWDQKQILQDVKETIRAQADTLRKAIESLQDNIERLKSEGQMGEEITGKMEQIQKSLKELVDLFGDSLLANLQSKQEISWDEMREAVKQATEMLPELNERLDNTLQFLELLKKDREMATLAMQAEKLAAEQSELQQNRDNSNSLSEQKRLLDRIEKYTKELSNPEENDPLITESAQSVDSLRRQMSSQSSQNQMPSSESMNSMSSSLLSLSQELREMMISGRSQRMQVEMGLMLDLARDALSLAEWQKSLREQMLEDDDRVKIARSQQAINDALTKLHPKTDSLRAIPPFMKQELREKLLSSQSESQTALQSLGESGSTEPMRQSQNSLNALAETILGAVSMMEGQQQSQGSCSAGGMLEGLRQLSGRQAAINSATSELLRQMMCQRPGSGEGAQGGEGSREARQEAQAAQKALAEELKKLAEKFGDGESGAMSKRVEELEKEARRIAEMLENPRQEISERQDRFLSRMLQAALSLNRQDEGKEERKSRTAENIFTENKSVRPGEILDDPDTFHLIRRKALQGNFPESYRPAVKAYFDSLGIMFLNKAAP
ncbi:MAG: hypothetical protein GX556_16285 [Fibrobacter sp.]|nr:hypothetical protein [Fibrobacter sp.]